MKSVRIAKSNSNSNKYLGLQILLPNAIKKSKRKTDDIKE
jgi:hypothetical protein